jgi:type II secretory pathway component PulF
MTLLSILLIPSFQEIFRDFGLQLPEFTMLLLIIADFLRVWGVPLVVLLGALLLFLVLKAYRVLPGRAFGWFGDRFRPPFGRRTAVARFARFMADLLEAGIKLPDALRIAGFTVNQSRMQRAAWRMASEIELRGRVAPAAYERPLTAGIVFALAPSAPAKSQVRLLRTISTCHAERVRTGLSWATGIVQPFAIVLVGAAVGLCVIALFLPLVTLVKGLSQ